MALSHGRRGHRRDPRCDDRRDDRVTRRQVLDLRLRAQQLDRDAGTVADTAVLDIGVQDTGADGALWALALRGVDAAAARRAGHRVDDPRGAARLPPRRPARVAAATAPFSDADAGKRIFDASKPLKAAGIPNLAALDAVADAMRSIVTAPMVKGEMSTRLTAVLAEPYLRFCRPCDAVHTLRAAVPAGRPARRARARAGHLAAGAAAGSRTGAGDRGARPARRRPRVPAAARPGHAAARRRVPRRPGQGREGALAGRRRRGHAWTASARWLLADGRRPASTRPPAEVTRLLAPVRPLPAGAGPRARWSPTPDRAKDLWRMLGRPGGVLVDGEIAGTWRARKSGSAVTVSVELWAPVDRRPARRAGRATGRVPRVGARRRRGDRLTGRAGTG